LNALLKEDTPFEWGRRHQEAFDDILKQLASPPLLTYPNEEYVQILSVDASYYGLGAILSQSPDGGPEAEKVIAYASRSLKLAESDYAPTHLEALAVVWGSNIFGTTWRAGSLSSSWTMRLWSSSSTIQSPIPSSQGGQLQ
jgi:hypothetical protein